MRVQQILMARLNALLKPSTSRSRATRRSCSCTSAGAARCRSARSAARLQVHPTSVTNLIDGLERSGLVRREPHEHDRRTTLAAITEVGRATAEEATLVLNEARFGTTPPRPSELEIWELLRRLRAAEDDFPID